MKMSQSPWMLHYDGSSCNGCDIEVLASTTPVYDLERFGIINTGDPKHADIFLITGGINYQNRSVVQQLYSQMPDPKVVVAVGICACDGGIFKDCYNILGGVDKVIPVDVYVPGCAARPESIIDGVVRALDLLEIKRDRMRRGLSPEEQGWAIANINEGRTGKAVRKRDESVSGGNKA
ncbi:Ni,Fe-hydrogenase III small subunit [Lachnospiraceae bacterium NK3A20]|jgi:ech hydrogenase subunit C|nr:Ni,Fe-hydrogenase III small subunit [Lachnospiraceae bacterium NK3A20]